MKKGTPKDNYCGYPDSLDHEKSQRALTNPPPLPEIDQLPSQRKPQGTSFPFRGKP